MGRISSGEISISGNPGMKVSEAARISIRTGNGSRSLSPTPTATTVASSSPMMSASWSISSLSPEVIAAAMRSGCVDRPRHFIGKQAGPYRGPEAALS
ncbi:hypothetical protein ACVWZ8_002491 [Arthrobacter sp. UYCu723]